MAINPNDWKNGLSAGQRSTNPGSDSYAPRYIGAYHMIGDDAYEPQRGNNFEVRIYGFENGLTTVDEGRKINFDVVQNCLTFSVQSVGGIGTEVGVIEIPYGNTKVKFAGLPSVNNLEIVYNDYIGKNTERVIAAWHAQVFNPKSQAIGRSSVYKKTGILIETAPDGSHQRVWNLQGVWPSNVQYGAYDYNSNEVRKITMTLTVDIAIPMDTGTE